MKIQKMFQHPEDARTPEAAVERQQRPHGIRELRVFIEHLPGVRRFSRCSNQRTFSGCLSQQSNYGVEYEDGA